MKTKPSNMDALVHSIELLVNCAGEIARVRRAHFEAYLKEGFTREEALVLRQKVTL